MTPRDDEVRMPGAGRPLLRAVKVAVWNVGGMSAGSLFMTACDTYGNVDILFMIEVKAAGLDVVQSILDTAFPGRHPTVHWVGVPCERGEVLAAGAAGAGQQGQGASIYGGIVAVVFNRSIRATVNSSQHDGVLSVDFNTWGMRTFTIIGVYLPHSASPKHHTVGDRLRHMKEEYLAARGRRNRTVIVGDLNIHVGDGDAHYCVKPDKSPVGLCMLLRGVLRECGVTPLHGRSRIAPAHPTSHAQGTTANGTMLALSRGKVPGQESDYILADASWVQGAEYKLYARDDLSVPYLGGPLPRSPEYHPLGPPRHDMVAVELSMVAGAKQRVTEGAAVARQRPKRDPVAAYNDPVWFAAAAGVSPIVDHLYEQAQKLQAENTLSTPEAAVMLGEGFEAIAASAMATMKGHSRRVPPGHGRDDARRQVSLVAPELLRARLGVRMRLDDRARLLARLQRAPDGKLIVSRLNSQLLEELDLVAKDIRTRLKLHKTLFRREVSRIIRVQGRREEALMRWDAHEAAVNFRRLNDEEFVMRGRSIIPPSNGMTAAERFRGHVAKQFKRPGGPRVPALQVLLATGAAAAVGAAIGAVHVPPEQRAPPGLPPEQWYDATVAHRSMNDWTLYWSLRARGLSAAKDDIHFRVVAQVARLEAEAAGALNAWAVPMPEELPAIFQQRVELLLQLRATLHARTQATHLEAARQSAVRTETLRADKAAHQCHRDCHACPELHGPIRLLYAALRDSCPDMSLPVVAGAAASAALQLLVAPVREPLPPPPNPLHIPRAEGEYLMRDVTALDVHEVLFPTEKKIRYCCISGTSLPLGAVSSCPACAKFNAEKADWDPDDIRSTAPECPTRLRTAKSGGLQGIVAELFRWMRPEARGDREAFRLKLCSVLALYFTGLMRAGKLPASFKEGLSLGLLKAVKVGRADPADPEFYRYITVSNTLPKLFGCVLLLRLSHWSDRTGLTSDSQNAFRAGRNCEHHVISLIELLRARRRGGRPTWMLFVDFSKAYDTVDHEALWEVLRRAGVPLGIVALLRDWNTGRTSSLSVNGELTDPFDITIGAPQGDVLSPWLFNLFVESLIRTIRADPILTGVTEFGINVRELMYADDLTMPCPSRQQVEHAVGIVSGWAALWGMRINFGRGKTEVVVFDEAPPLGGYRPVEAAGATVPVVGEYRYLGLPINARLDYESLITRYAKKMSDNYFRFFRSNVYVRKMSLRAQSIQLRTFVLSATTFLAAALPAHTPEAAQSLDDRLRELLANMLGLDAKTAQRSLLQDGKVPLTMFTWAGARTRVYLEAMSPATHNPHILAHRIIMRQSAPAYRDPDTWLAQTERMFAAAGFRPQPCPHCHVIHAGLCTIPVASVLANSARGIKRASRMVARAIATMQWAKASRHGVWDSASFLARPPGVGKDCLILFRQWLNCGYPADPNVIGPWAGLDSFTPLSYTAPGGSGNIICNAEIPVAMATVLLHARQGSAAHKYRKPCGKLAHPTSCNACGASVGDPYHFLFECTHATCRVGQRRAQKLLRDCIPAIVARTRDIAKQGKVPKLAAAPMLAHAAEVEEALKPMNNPQWASAAGVTVLARLSYGQPWSVRSLPGALQSGRAPAEVLLCALGRLFDSVAWPPCLTRNLCTQWAFKASKAHRIGNEVRDATHPTAPAHRRGGAEAYNAECEARRRLAAVRAAEADAVEAEDYVAAHGAIPPSELVPGACRRRDLAKQRRRAAAAAASGQSLLSAFFAPRSGE